MHTRKWRKRNELQKEDYIYVGIDLHKETHTAVISDCWNTKLGEITFANTPAEFPKLVRKVKKYCIDGKISVYGLENAYGYGRSLAVWLLEKNYIVKDVNTFLSNRQAKRRAMYKRSDSDDAQAIALQQSTCLMNYQTPVQMMLIGQLGN